MLRLVDTVSTHTHIRLSARRLKAAIRLREQVREAAIDFGRHCLAGHGQYVPGPAGYYYGKRLVPGCMVYYNVLDK